MQNDNIPVKPYAEKFGVLFGGYSILILVLLYLFNTEQNTAISLLNFSITVGIVWYAIHLYKNDNEGVLDLMTSIKLGLAIGVIGGLIYAGYTYIHYEYVQPEFIENMKSSIDSEVLAEIENQQMTDEEAEMTKNVSAAFASPFVLATIALLSIIFKTFLVGLIIGLIKRNN